METSIATVSLSGGLTEKLEAIAAAGFTGVEIFESDLLSFNGTPKDVRRMAESLGLRIVTFQPFRDFEGMPEPQRGWTFARAERKFDLIISSMTATPERAREISFLEYFQAGTSILVPRGNPEGVKSMADLCGATVTLQAGTIHEELVDGQQADCGANPIRARPLESGTQVVLEVKFGRADAALADFPVAAYNAKVSGQGRDFQVVGDQIDPGPYGIGVRKDDGDLQSVLQEALRAIIEDGSYDRVLTKWNVTDGALKSARLTGGA